MAIYQHITQLVGRTPIVQLHQVVPADAAEVYVKLESFNPGSSVKDRIALAMIEEAEERGLLKPGVPIVEPTSGNTGIGLSWIGAAKGYPVIITMPETMSLERQQLIRAYGAQLVLTPGSAGTQGAIDKAKEIAHEVGGWVPLQFENPANPLIHQTTTAQEILQDFGQEGLDAFVAGIGTGGTITGVSHALKKSNPKIQIIGVEAAESAVLSGSEPGPHKIQGISTGFIPKALDTESYDRIQPVASETALQFGRSFGRKEGFLIGISGAAAILTAIEIAKELGKGKKVLALAADNGERYLSTALYQDSTDSKE